MNETRHLLRYITCPHCDHVMAIHVMRLSALCPCGWYYVDVEPYTGWYKSREAFCYGERIAP